MKPNKTKNNGIHKNKIKKDFVEDIKNSFVCLPSEQLFGGQTIARVEGKANKINK